MPHSRSLKTPDAKLRLLEEKLSVGTWTWDLQSSEITWSPGLFRMLGFDPMSVVPTLDLYQSLVHPEDQISFDNAIGLASDKRIQNRRFRIIRPDGSLRWLQSRAQPHLDRNGKTVLLFGVIADVTDEEELRANAEVEAKVGTILTRLLKGKVWRAHPDGKLIETADWTRLTGETASQAHDWNALAAIHPADRETFRQAWKSAIATEGEYAVKIRVKTVGGDYVRIASRALPLRGADGEIEQWIGHSVYVDERAIDETPGLCASQIRAARGFLDWTARDLATHSGISFSTIRRMEQSTTAVRPESLLTVQATFEKQGLTFSRREDGSATICRRPPD